MKKLLPLLIVILVVIAGGTSYLAYSAYKDYKEPSTNNRNEYVNYYNEYSRYIEETESAIDTAKKSYDVLVFLKSNRDYNISNIDEKAKNMLNRALGYAFDNSDLDYDEVNEIEYIVMNAYVNDSIKQQYSEELLKAVEREKLERSQQGVRIGMTKEEVLLSNWGKPLDINKTTNVYGTSEQWVYKNNNYLYFDDGVLTSIQN